MGAGYKSVLWNKQKRTYDLVMLLGIVLYLSGFIVVTLLTKSTISPESLIIRATGTLAFLMLHIILCIGPLARIHKRFLPLLYNRRHLGVTMFLFALVHGVFSLIQFHTLGNIHPLVSLFTANTHYGSVMRFPFQTLGFFALMILFLMAATSHDFWLKNLSPKVWKTLHMVVYFAYALLLMHVLLGAIQLEQSPVWIGILALGMVTVVSLHLLSAFSSQISEPDPTDQGFHRVGHIDEIPEDRAKMIRVGKEEIAVFKYDGKLSAVHNSCKHQNGPLSEGKVVDGCITCPWHGYQYQPEDGCSPPPFTEKLSTYDLKLQGGIVYVHPHPYPEGTAVPPVIIHKTMKS